MSLRILMAPQQDLEFFEYLRVENMPFKVVNENVAESIRREHAVQRLTRSPHENVIDFESYQRLDAINSYMEYLAREYAHQVNIVNLGKSYEGRALRAIHISGENVNGALSKKPLIFIDAGMHAREWISHATALYILHQLVENSSSHRYELDMFDWLIWPVVNPDGYEYSHTRERFWRKSRQRNGGTTSCVGVDLNRNFDFHWSQVGSSDNPCDIDYHGPKAFSEPEAIAMRDLLFHINSTCQMYLTLHAYGNYLLYPWGYESSLPSNWRYHDAVARSGANAIKRSSGTSYTVGSSAKALYAASGASDDFAYGAANIPVALCMELPSGGNGFDPAPKEILPIVAESWLGIRAMAREIVDYPLRNRASVFSKDIIREHKKYCFSSGYPLNNG
ncbi:carboxypeptidase B1 [Stomoxys calcitrans]|uniref:carboxypeptidase B1 n=1 Tax=Stomoxys calcitrans TaxID=35570 RepID=UPI0027E245F3|nr:carboxypeptidase B1 [Stomoxys calcitrans]